MAGGNERFRSQDAGCKERQGKIVKHGGFTFAEQ